ncbi:MAG: translation initiation factor IF-3 [Deltaproteobacteria bacterium]|nr:MAG: translation initiation factor IF-3 [Deltaproteobacteria bacterium]
MADTRRAARKDVPRINERIREPEIRVIGSEGEQLGVMASEDALRRAEEVGLDLVEVAPGSRPPVCRIMDYGRYKYEQQKKKKAGKGKSHSATLKEVKLRPRTDDHDLETKLKNVRRFLMDGDKVKITVMFRGREMVHRQMGHKQLRRVTDMLGKLATVENPARMEGRFLSMILVSNKEGVAEARKEMEAAAKAEAEAVASEEAAEARPE